MNIDAEEYIEKLTGKKLTLGSTIWCIRRCDYEDKSQAEFAKMLGVSRQFLCDLEKDRRTISPKKAKEFAEILGYSVNQFVSLAIKEQLRQDNIHMEVTLTPIKSTKQTKHKNAHAH